MHIAIQLGVDSECMGHAFGAMPLGGYRPRRIFSNSLVVIEYSQQLASAEQ